jgi:regulator of RNase E activity RraA
MDTLRDAFGSRYNTPLIADAAFRAQVDVVVPRPGVLPLADAYTLAGPVRTVNANNDLVTIIAVVGRADPGEVVVIANAEGDAGLIGDLVGTDAHNRELAGIVVDGLVRDAPALIEIGLPVFSRGRCPVGPLKLPPDLKGVGEIDTPVSIGGATVTPGMWVFGDMDGVIFVGAEDLAKIAVEADRALEREAGALAAMAQGTSLSELLAIEEFLARRAADPNADFNAHLAQRDKAI